MGNVVDLGGKMLKRGAPMFLVCPKCQDDSHMAPIGVAGAGGKPIICSIVCLGPQCTETQTVMHVVQGVIEEVTQEPVE